MLALRKRPPMVARNIGDDLDLVARETAQFTVSNEILGMLVVLALMDEIADIVQDRGILQPIALGCA